MWLLTLSYQKVFHAVDEDQSICSLFNEERVFLSLMVMKKKNALKVKVLLLNIFHLLNLQMVYSIPCSLTSSDGILSRRNSTRWLDWLSLRLWPRQQLALTSLLTWAAV